MNPSQYHLKQLHSILKKGVYNGEWRLIVPENLLGMIGKGVESNANL